MTPSTQLNWIILTVIGIVTVSALFGWLLIFLSQRSLARKRAKFKPSIIVDDIWYFEKVDGDDFQWILEEIDSQVITSYDQAITLLSAIKEKYPNAELKPIDEI